MAEAYFGCRSWQSSSRCSVGHSRAGSPLRWGRCPRAPQASGSQCFAQGSPWCSCAERPQSQHRPEIECSERPHARTQGQLGPDLKEVTEKHTRMKRQTWRRDTSKAKTFWCSDWQLTCDPMDFVFVDELGDVTAHQLGVGSGGWVVLLGTGQPINNHNIGLWFPLIQRCHQLGHPALKHACHLWHNRAPGVSLRGVQRRRVSRSRRLTCCPDRTGGFPTRCLFKSSCISRRYSPSTRVAFCGVFTIKGRKEPKEGFLWEGSGFPDRTKGKQKSPGTGVMETFWERDR
ncbi:hypothetical protein JZ751_014183 [Albula glossodonta]|uniref:Uncharacterized protein n=1 Tax=Albula glossodonta TaxID=121402 RepID=A0A8T2NSR8_9TELE|nr:hypothetical protein JZ751_014183 [Albula glossodonta]